MSAAARGRCRSRGRIRCGAGSAGCPVCAVCAARLRRAPAGRRRNARRALVLRERARAFCGWSC
eukprot:362360-Chlamydomonas_euryale.AAC.3